MAISLYASSIGPNDKSFFNNADELAALAELAALSLQDEESGIATCITLL